MASLPIQFKQVQDQNCAFIHNTKISHEVSPLNTAVIKDEKQQRKKSHFAKSSDVSMSKSMGNASLEALVFSLQMRKSKSATISRLVHCRNAYLDTWSAGTTHVFGYVRTFFLVFTAQSSQPFTSKVSS